VTLCVLMIYIDSLRSMFFKIICAPRAFFFYYYFYIGMILIKSSIDKVPKFYSLYCYNFDACVILLILTAINNLTTSCIQCTKLYILPRELYNALLRHPFSFIQHYLDHHYHSHSTTNQTSVS